MKRLLLITALISSPILWCAEQAPSNLIDDVDDEAPSHDQASNSEAIELLEIVKAMPSAKDLALLSPYQRIQEKTSWSRKAVAAQKDKDLFSLFTRDAAMKTAANYLIEKGYPDLFKQLYMPEGNFYGKLNELNLIPDNQGKTLLHYAAQSGSLDAIEIVKNFGNQMDIFIMRDHAGRTPLHYAVMNNNLAAVKALSQNIRYIFTANNNGHTPLSIAQDNNYHEIVKFFEEIALPAAQLRQAIEDGNLDAAQRLIDAGTDVNDLETEQYSPLLSPIQEDVTPMYIPANLARVQFQKVLTLEALINAGANLYFQDAAGRTLIDHALIQCIHDDTYLQMNPIALINNNDVLVMPSLEILERLIAARAPIKKSINPEILEELLSIGTRYNRPLIAKAALEAGAKANYTTYLFNAILARNLELVKILLSHGAKTANHNLELAQLLQIESENPEDLEEIVRILQQVRPATPRRLHPDLQLRYKGNKKQ